MLKHRPVTDASFEAFMVMFQVRVFWIVMPGSVVAGAPS
jgi:hypothetical protein